MSHRYFDDEQKLDFAGSEPLLLDFENDSGVAIAYTLAGGLMEICGPLFWGALILGFLSAEFTPL